LYLKIKQISTDYLVFWILYRAVKTGYPAQSGLTHHWLIT